MQAFVNNSGMQVHSVKRLLVKKKSLHWSMCTCTEMTTLKKTCRQCMYMYSVCSVGLEVWLMAAMFFSFGLFCFLLSR